MAWFQTAMQYIGAFAQTPLGMIVIIVIAICVFVGAAKAFMDFSEDTVKSFLFGAFWIAVILLLFFNRDAIGGWIEGSANLPHK